MRTFFLRSGIAAGLTVTCMLGLVLMSSGAAAQTYVGGPISGNVTWGPSGSPYVLTSSIEVNTGATLTILPGVTVRRQSGAIAVYNGGKLFADGVTFEGAGTDDNGILYTYGTGAFMQVQNCTFTYIHTTRFAIHILGPASDISVSNSTFTGFEDGIALKSNSANSQLQVLDCEFNQCIYPIYVLTSGCTVNVYTSAFSGITGSGVLLTGNSGVYADGCVFEASPSGTGIRMTTAGTCTVTHSCFTDLSIAINNTTGVTLSAENNWWGSASGPTHPSNPVGTGETIIGNVDFDPFLTSDPGCGGSPPPVCPGESDWTQEYTTDDCTVGLWHFNENSGPIAYDSSPNNQDCNIHNASWTTDGKFDAALFFDGGDSATVELSSTSFITGSHTVEAWVYPTNVGTLQTILSLYGVGDQIPMYLHPDGRVSFRLVNSAHLSPQTEVYSTTALQNNRWYHIAARWDDDAHMLAIFVNGTMESEVPVAWSPTALSSNTMDIGKLWTTQAVPNGAASYFHGHVDEVRVSRTLRRYSQPPNHLPTAVLSASYDTHGELSMIPVLFSMTASADSDGNLLLYELDFDSDGTYDFASSSPEASHNYDRSAREILVTLRVTDDRGGTDMATVSMWFSAFQYGVDSYSFSNDDMAAELGVISWQTVASAIWGVLSKPLLLAIVDLTSKDNLLCSGIAATSGTYYIEPWLRPLGLSGTPYSWSRSNILLQEAIKKYHLVFNVALLLDFPEKTTDIDEIAQELDDLCISLQSNKPMAFSYRYWYGSGDKYGHTNLVYGIIRNSDQKQSLICYETESRTGPYVVDFQLGGTEWDVTNSYNTVPEIYRAGFSSPKLGAVPLSMKELRVVLLKYLASLISEERARVIVACPVDVSLVDSEGNTAGRFDGVDYDELPDVIWSCTNDLWSFSLPSDSPYLVRIQGRDTGTADIAGYIPTADSKADVLAFSIPIACNSYAEVRIGPEVRDLFARLDQNGDDVLEDSVHATEWAWDIDPQSTVDVGSVSGAVLCNGVYMKGVAVDLFTVEGVLVASTATTLQGTFGFENLESGQYAVSVVSPIGYSCNQETVEIAISGTNCHSDFELFRLATIPDQRSKGYWTHQVNFLLSGREPQETLAQMCEYMELIRIHFNEHQLNPIAIFAVDLNADCNARLEALRDVISPRPNAPMDEKAKSHFVALLLNIVSGKIAQWAPISEDLATASQAVTFCHILITDGDPVNDERAKDIMEMINEGETVPADWIDLATPDIAYKQTGGTTAVPTALLLNQSYPNPFNAGTIIPYSLDAERHVILQIFDILGRRVATLVDERQPPGQHAIAWDGTSASGRPLASGMYFYRLTAGDVAVTKKMVVLK